VACMGQMKNVYKILVRKTEGKRLLGRPIRRWEDNMRMNLSETGLIDVDCSKLAQDTDQWRAFVNMVMNF